MAIHVARRTYPGLVLLAAAIAVGGCKAIGPRTVDADRIDYSTAITESWKRQTLLNVVKLRYADPPIFVDIGSIIAGYSLETSVTVGLGDQDTPLGATDSISLGGAGRFTDRPTITYIPLTGNNFVNNLITPIPPVSLFSAIQAGWNADTIVRLGVGAINGIANEQISGGGYVPADPRFLRVVELMRELQGSGAMTIRVERGQDGGPATLLTLPSSGRVQPPGDSTRELRELLQLEAGQSEFFLVFGRNSTGGGEIAVQSRSLLNILQIMSAQAVVPEQHVREGRASAPPKQPESRELAGVQNSVVARKTGHDVRGSALSRHVVLRGRHGPAIEAGFLRDHAAVHAGRFVAGARGTRDHDSGTVERSGTADSASASSAQVDDAGSVDLPITSPRRS